MTAEYDFAIVGGGASGLAAAITASEKGEKVVIMESGPALGRKVLASGNGRCNLMNGGEPRYYGDSRFAQAVLRRCGKKEQTEFWHHLGVMVSEDHEQRLYPATFQSATVVDALKTGIKANGVRVMLNTPCLDIHPAGNGFLMSGSDGCLLARRLLIAAGGFAGIKKREPAGSGYELLQRLGHTLIPVRPALVPLMTDKKSISGLAGIRCRCGVRLLDKSGGTLHREKGEVLFTETGISGICIMQCARFLEEGSVIELDLSEMAFGGEGAIWEEMEYRRERFRNMPPDMLLNGIVHAKLSYAVMKQAGIPMRGETVADLDHADLLRIVDTFRHYRVHVAGTKGMEEAQVTAGGIQCGEFRDDNMESRIVPGVFASGEVLNVDGDCGGYNLMFAFGSGILAGLNHSGNLMNQ